jgi:hypothetical protein
LLDSQEQNISKSVSIVAKSGLICYSKKLQMKKKRLKNIKIDKKTGTIYLKSSTTKGEDLERRLKGRHKKKLSKRAAARKKANRNRGFWRPDKPTGMTQ